MAKEIRSKNYSIKSIRANLSEINLKHSSILWHEIWMNLTEIYSVNKEKLIGSMNWK